MTLGRLLEVALTFGALAAIGALCLGSTSCSTCEDCDVEPTPMDAAAHADAEPAPDLGADAGEPDSGEIDSGEPDAGPAIDAGAVFNAGTCLVCGEACNAAGGVCAMTRQEQFCLDRCDSDLNGCLAGFTCVDIDDDAQRALYVCVPPIARCAAFGVGFGTPCYGDTSLCQIDRRRCQGDVEGMGYCTDPCVRGGCPEGYACGPGDGDNPDETVCLAKFGPDAERCGRESRAGEIACTNDDTCGAGARCVLDLPGLPGVCARELAAACATAPCGASEACRANGAGGSLCVPSRCGCRGDHRGPGATRDLLSEALGGVGLSRCTATFGIHDWVVSPNDVIGDPYRLSHLNPTLSEPWRAPGFGGEVTLAIDRSGKEARSPSYRAARMVEELAKRLDRPAVRHPIGPIDPVSPLASAVAAFVTAAGGMPETATIARDASDVPLALQLAVAEVIDGARRALVARRTGILAPAGGQAVVDVLFDYGPAFLVPRPDGQGLDARSAQVRSLLNDTIRYGEIFGGTADLLDAIDGADIASFAVTATVGTATVATSTATLIFNQMTPAGRIAIGDGGSGIYDPRAPDMGGDWALLVDLGGHDTYRISAGGNSSATNGVSALIDLGGRDRYEYVVVPHARDADAPSRLPSDAGGRYTPRAADEIGAFSFSDSARQGAGRAGVGVLVDLGPDPDRYRSLRMSQGAGFLGAGVLIDEGGDDDYAAEAASQGAGSFGIGLLLDLGGRDRRFAYTEAQGFGFARGAGLVYDLEGDDEYLLDVGDPTLGGDPIYSAPQRARMSNSSLGQGFGYGRRDDTTRAFMSGGLGLLIDASGADRYEGSIFTQGGGYWFGTGVLADLAGDDRYDGMWYAMGSGAHYALGMLLDAAGNDTYGGGRLPRINVTIAGGHDYSAAFLVDESGNDVYNGSRITIGSGNATGIGFFVDNGGDDRYLANGPYAIGAAGLLDMDLAMPGSPRRKVDVLGVFIDAGGTDSYEIGGMPATAQGDGRSWRGPQSMDPLVRRIELGTGVDGEGDSTLHAFR